MGSYHGDAQWGVDLWSYQIIPVTMETVYSSNLITINQMNPAGFVSNPPMSSCMETGLWDGFSSVPSAHVHKLVQSYKQKLPGQTGVEDNNRKLDSIITMYVPTPTEIP